MELNSPDAEVGLWPECPRLAWTAHTEQERQIWLRMLQLEYDTEQQRFAALR